MPGGSDRDALDGGAVGTERRDRDAVESDAHRPGVGGGHPEETVRFPDLGLAGSEGPRALAALGEVVAHCRARVLALPAQNNLVGSLLAGAYRELLPGAEASGAPPGWTALDTPRKWSR